MMTFKKRNKALGSIRWMLLMAVALSSLLPVFARAGEERADGDRADAMAAPDDELVGTLPFFFDPGNGMPIPEDSGAGPGDDDTDLAGGGGSILAPVLPPVQGAPKFFLYGPHNLLSLHRSAVDGQNTGQFHADLTNPGYSYLVLEGSRQFRLPVSLFTQFGVQAGLLTSGDEIDPLQATVGYLGQYSNPFEIAAKSRKDFPVAALQEYGFLNHGVGLFTRSSLHGRTHMVVRGVGDRVTFSILHR